MKTYEFNVKLYGKISLEVVATSKKEAKQMVQDLIEGITVKDIELRESSNKDITIKDGTVLKEINSKNRDMER